MAELHALVDLLAADLLGGAPLAHVILLLCPLGPVGGGAPHDGGQAPVIGQNMSRDLNTGLSLAAHLSCSTSQVLIVLVHFSVFPS